MPRNRELEDEQLILIGAILFKGLDGPFTSR